MMEEKSVNNFHSVRAILAETRSARPSVTITMQKPLANALINDKTDLA